LDCLMLEMRPVWSSKTLGMVYSLTQHNILEDLNFQRGQREKELASLFNTQFIYLWLFNNAISNSNYLEVTCSWWPNLSYYSVIIVEEPRKPISSLSQHTLYSSQDLYRTSPK
jgi:hypothetical protein